MAQPRVRVEIAIVSHGLTSSPPRGEGEWCLIQRHSAKPPWRLRGFSSGPRLHSREHLEEWRGSRVPPGACLATLWWKSALSRGMACDIATCHRTNHK